MEIHILIKYFKVISNDFDVILNKKRFKKYQKNMTTVLLQHVSTTGSYDNSTGTNSM